MARWFDDHWARLTTSFSIGGLFGYLIVGLVSGQYGPTAELLGFVVALVIGVWTVEFLRRDFITGDRPFVAIKGTRADAPNELGTFPLTLVLTNFGRSPGSVVREFASYSFNGVETDPREGSVTQREIVFPGEEITFSYEVQAGGWLHWGCEYRDLDGRRQYEYSILYTIVHHTHVPIVAKVAT